MPGAAPRRHHGRWEPAGCQPGPPPGCLVASQPPWGKGLGVSSSPEPPNPLTRGSHSHTCIPPGWWEGRRAKTTHPRSCCWTTWTASPPGAWGGGWKEVGVRERGWGAGGGPSPAPGPGVTHGAGICGRLILFSRSAERRADSHSPATSIRARWAPGCPPAMPRPHAQ